MQNAAVRIRARYLLKVLMRRSPLNQLHELKQYRFSGAHGYGCFSSERYNMPSPPHSDLLRFFVGRLSSTTAPAVSCTKSRLPYNRRQELIRASCRERV